MMLHESPLSQRAAEESLPLRDAFAVLFFVSVGMLFDPSILIRAPLLVVATLLVILIGNSLTAFGIMRAFGYPMRTALTVAASLAQIGEFSFILAGLGVALEILPAAGRDLILAGALISIIANPILFFGLERMMPARRRKNGAAAYGTAAGRGGARRNPDDKAQRSRGADRLRPRRPRHRRRAHTPQAAVPGRGGAGPDRNRVARKRDRRSFRRTAHSRACSRQRT